MLSKSRGSRAAGARRWVRRIHWGPNEKWHSTRTPNCQVYKREVYCTQNVREVTCLRCWSNIVYFTEKTMVEGV
jgi:hypothetical protein